MSIEVLKSNIIEAKKIIAEIKKLHQQCLYSDSQNKNLINDNINLLVNRLYMTNEAIPEILNSISTQNSSSKSNISRLKYKSISSGNDSLVSIKKQDKEKFIKELSISEVGIKKINDKSSSKTIKPNAYATISTKMFGGLANAIAPSLSDLKKDLKESNSRFLISTYVSIALLTTLISFFASIFLIVLLIILKVNISFFLVIPIFALFGVPIGFYLMPSLNRSSLRKDIANELPFAVIYMSAISGSSIEPTKIFKIVAESSEYKHIGIEMKKIITQVEIYGYDLVNTLKNVAKTTISPELSELLNGMATNISSGSSIKNYLEKKSETLLMDYKLDRSKYNEVAATFMDVYISVLITAPLILVMMVVIMDLTGLKLGDLSTDTLLTLSIGLVALVNIFFLMFLHLRQPKV